MLQCASVASTSTTDESDIDDMQNQTEVQLSINFGVLSANDDVALSHFITRVTSSIAFLTFDPIIHAETPSFARGTSCSVLLPWERAVYNVTSVIILGSRALQLTLKTASVRDTHAMLDVTLKWDPNAAREVARRRAAGEPLGEDVRRRTRGRDLADTVTGTGSVSINWNGQTGAAAAATVDSIDVIPPAPGLMTCKNCFAYIAASYSVTFQVVWVNAFLDRRSFQPSASHRRSALAWTRRSHQIRDLLGFLRRKTLREPWDTTKTAISLLRQHMRTWLTVWLHSHRGWPQLLLAR